VRSRSINTVMKHVGFEEPFGREQIFLLRCLRITTRTAFMSMRIMALRPCVRRDPSRRTEIREECTVEKYAVRKPVWTRMTLRWTCAA
jgi:hypothetical protein